MAQLKLTQAQTAELRYLIDMWQRHGVAVVPKNVNSARALQGRGFAIQGERHPAGHQRWKPTIAGERFLAELACSQCGGDGVVPVDDDIEGDWEWKDCPECLRVERGVIAAKAREYAEHYPHGSDGRNTFTLFAEWVEARNATGEAEDVA